MFGRGGFSCLGAGVWGPTIVFVGLHEAGLSRFRFYFPPGCWRGSLDVRLQTFLVNRCKLLAHAALPCLVKDGDTVPDEYLMLSLGALHVRANYH